MELLYNVHDRPSKGKTLIFALQQLLAILAGTITLPLIVGNGMSQASALLGAGLGTLVYLAITKFRSPIFLGSSFTYLAPMTMAFAGAAALGGLETQNIGFLGILMGAILSGLVYVILSLIIRKTGIGWVEKAFPPIVIGPVVILIGLTLSPGAISNLFTAAAQGPDAGLAGKYVCLAVGLVTMLSIAAVAVHGKTIAKFIPFIIGILAGYLLASVFTIIGNIANVDALKVIDFSLFKNINWAPDFVFVHAFKGAKAISGTGNFWPYFGLIFGLYVPLSFAVFSEYIADHKNLSFIINHDLTKDPGLARTAMGDGLGSMVGAFFGGCPNTTYGESISCVAFSRNASTITILVTAIISIVISFFAPLMVLFESIPSCIVGGLSIALYGYIAASGLKMLQKVDLSEIKNIFIVSAIMVTGIGGMVLDFYYFQITSIPTALVIGFIVNLVVNYSPKKKKENKEEIPENLEK